MNFENVFIIYVIVTIIVHSLGFISKISITLTGEGKISLWNFEIKSLEARIAQP